MTGRATSSVPAIHRNRSEIREIFLREMPDAPRTLTDNPPELAGAAREHLRRAFLSAKVGVSGANFAIADTGSLVVVESEGNGRMCVTLPETLISVVGIEKVLPSWRDLEVFLALLPRSSTAERMNPYTSIWSGVTPGDGPREFHLVLLDNGRTSHARRPHRAPGAAVYPLFGVPERVPRLRAGRRPRVRVALSRARSVPSCLRSCAACRRRWTGPCRTPPALCGACYEVCPVAINIPEALVYLRSKAVDAKRDKKFNPERAVVRGHRVGTALAPAAQGRPARRVGEPEAGRPLGDDPAAAAAAQRLDRHPRRARAPGGVVPRLVGPHPRPRAGARRIPAARGGSGLATPPGPPAGGPEAGERAGARAWHRAAAARCPGWRRQKRARCRGRFRARAAPP